MTPSPAPLTLADVRRRVNAIAHVEGEATRRDLRRVLNDLAAALAAPDGAR